MSQQTKSLNAIDAVALTIGSMVGAGIFTVLALTVKTAGAAAVLAWLLVVILSLPMAYCFSDLTGILAQSGGPYVYIRDRTKRWVGLWVAWSFLVSAVGATEALFMSLVGMLNQIGVAHGPWIGAIILFIISFVLSRGIHLGALVQRILTVGTVALLLSCIIIGFTHMHSTVVVHDSGQYIGIHSRWQSVLHSVAPHGLIAILPATFFAFWTYSGWEAVVVPSDSYHSPKALARGMMIGSLVVGVLYILVALACVLCEPASAIAHSFNPLVAVGNLWSPWFGYCVSWGAILVVCGSLLSWMIASATLVQSVVRDGLFPASKAIRNYAEAYHPVLPVGLACLMVLGAQLPIFSGAIAASSLTALVPYAVVFGTVAFDRSAEWEGVFKRKRTRRFVAFSALFMSGLLIGFSGWSNIWPTLILLAIGGCLIYVRHPKVLKAGLKQVNEP